MTEPLPAIELRVCPPRGRIELRGDPGDPSFVKKVSDVLGLEPPLVSNTGRSGHDTVILWLGPDAWSIVVPADKENDVARELQSSLSGLHASVAPVGAGGVTFSLAGPEAAAVLAKGMTLDLYPDRFRAGACARSLLTRIPVLLHRPGDALAYEITVPRSYADFARDWLEDASLEYRGAA